MSINALKTRLQKTIKRQEEALEGTKAEYEQLELLLEKAPAKK